MATTAGDLVAETKRHLLSFQREPMNKLAAPLTAGTTTLSFLYAIDQIQAGSYVEVGLELMYVWSVEPATRSAVVQRAQLGSVATTHDTGDIARVNPRFPDFAILKAINDDIVDLSSPGNGLYAVRSATVSSVGGRTGYDLSGTAGLIDIIEVRYDGRDSSQSWPLLPSWSLARQVDTADFPSNLTLNTNVGIGGGRALHVLYKGSFAKLTSLADDVETVAGLAPTMLDLPPMGAAVRMVAPREIKRNQTEAQGEPRRAAEVGPGAVAASLRGIAALRANRIAAEANRLVAAYPTRFPQTHTGGSW